MSIETSAPGRQGVGEDAQQKAQQIAGQAQEKAQETAEQAKGKLREQIDQRSTQAAEQINEQASDLRAVGESLRERGQESPARAADRLAEYAERIGGYLRDKDSHALLNDAEDFGRRQPWAVGAGALVLGFAGARFLKASSRQRYSTRSGPMAGPAGRPSMTPRASHDGGADGYGAPVVSPPAPTFPPPSPAIPNVPPPGTLPPTGV